MEGVIGLVIPMFVFLAFLFGVLMFADAVADLVRTLVNGLGINV